MRLLMPVLQCHQYTPCKHRGFHTHPHQIMPKSLLFLDSPHLASFRPLRCDRRALDRVTNQKHGPNTGKKKSIHHPPWKNPPFFFFGVWGSMVYTLLAGTYCVYPFSLVFPRKNGIHHSFFLLCDLGVGRQTEKGGVPRWWYTLFFLEIGRNCPKKCPKIVFSAFSDIFRTFCQHSLCLGPPAICPLQSFRLPCRAFEVHYPGAFLGGEWGHSSDSLRP